MSDKYVNRDCADESQFVRKGMNCVAPPEYIVTTFQVEARPNFAMKKATRWTEQPLVPGKQPGFRKKGNGYFPDIVYTEKSYEESYVISTEQPPVSTTGSAGVEQAALL